MNEPKKPEFTDSDFLANALNRVVPPVDVTDLNTDGSGESPAVSDKIKEAASMLITAVTPAEEQE